MRSVVVCGTLLLALAPTAAATFTPTAYLPPLLSFRNGSAVPDAGAWAQRREELKEDLQAYILGRFPPTAPPLLRFDVLNRTAHGYHNAESAFVRLTFDVSAGGGDRGPELAFDIEMLLPRPAAGTAAAKPAPVVLTQWNHRQWALRGLSRGYIGVVYPGADARDVAPAWQAAYPRATFALIAARAFVAQRALDFVLAPNSSAALGYAPDAKAVAITGHSRNGKQSLIAAAFDERFTAVVGSSPGAPIASPWRFTTSNFYGESPGTGRVVGPGTPQWWINRTLDFDQHPENSPADGHMVVALIAPRACAIATGHADDASDMVFGNEMSARAVQPVYDLLLPGRRTAPFRLMLRPGAHHGFDDVGTYFDFFEFGFAAVAAAAAAAAGGGGADMAAPALAPPACRGCWYTDPSDLGSYATAAGFSWATWQASRSAAQATADAAVPARTAPLPERVAWLLSAADAPQGFAWGDLYCEESEAAYTAAMMHHAPSDSSIKMVAVSFGEYKNGLVYFRADLDKSAPAPAVVWLHPYAYNTGFAPRYGGGNVVHELAAAGYVVFAFEMAGFGLRNVQGGARFYEPARRGGRGDASLFGEAVQDVRAALDFLSCRNPAALASDARCRSGAAGGAPESAAKVSAAMPVVDMARVALAGFSLGGAVALHAAALDARARAVAAFAAFTPWRTDAEGRPTGGARRLFEMHALLPRLGLFQRDLTQAPYDYDELIAALAPRPTLLYTPQHDRDATYGDVAKCTAAAAKAWAGAAAANLTVQAPVDNSRMERDQISALLSWLTSALTAAK